VSSPTTLARTSLRPGRQRRERPHVAASLPRRAARWSPHLHECGSGWLWVWPPGLAVSAIRWTPPNGGGWVEPLRSARFDGIAELPARFGGTSASGGFAMRWWQSVWPLSWTVGWSVSRYAW